MEQSLTERLQQTRFVVVEIDKSLRRLRLREAADRCTDLTCHESTAVVTDEGARGDLDALNPGDVIKLDSQANRVDRIVVLRRAWDEIASPEL